ncbi:MAG: hypothetical protein [Microvirus sp.]|nr:MAG: hypothetical protein [Microvirus sp.]
MAKSGVYEAKANTQQSFLPSVHEVTPTPKDEESIKKTM